MDIADVTVPRFLVFANMEMSRLREAEDRITKSHAPPAQKEVQLRAINDRRNAVRNVVKRDFGL